MAYWGQYTSGFTPILNPLPYTDTRNLPAAPAPAQYTRGDAVRDFRASLYRGSGDMDLELYVNQLPDPTLISRDPAATAGWLDGSQPDPTSGSASIWTRHRP